MCLLCCIFNLKYICEILRNSNPVPFSCLKSELEKSGIHHDQILKSINNLASTRDTVNDYLKRVIKIAED